MTCAVCKENAPNNNWSVKMNGKTVVFCDEPCFLDYVADLEDEEEDEEFPDEDEEETEEEEEDE